MVLAAISVLACAPMPSFAQMPFDPNQPVTRHVENVDLTNPQDRQRLRDAVDRVAAQTCANAVAMTPNVRCRRQSQRQIESRLTQEQRAAVAAARAQRR
jgi:hypothetical protein